MAGVRTARSEVGEFALKSTWLISPHVSAAERKLLKQLQKRVPQRSGVVWIQSSGTRSGAGMKWIALDREAVETSARTVNRWLKSKSTDRWLRALPRYHIGGYAIEVRARLSRARLFEYKLKWSSYKFVEVLNRHRITLTSLVPTQVFDLVECQLKSPDSLRAVIVGGGELSEDLYLKARQLGWPLLPSYGLTECASQVATASLASIKLKSYPSLEILPHVKAELSGGVLNLRSKSICRWIVRIHPNGEMTVEAPALGGSFRTEDRAELYEQSIKILGRKDQIVKRLGVLVDLNRIQLEVSREFNLVIQKYKLTNKSETRHLIWSRPDTREGAVLIWVTDARNSFEILERAMGCYNVSASGPNRIQTYYWVPRIPRTSLGKLKVPNGLLQSTY